MEVSLSSRYHLLRTLACGAIGWLAAPALASAAAPPPIPKLTPDAVTHHALVLDGRTLTYAARA
ncbi:MAG TPA: hypothetical protein VFU90_03080, partial [Candidatus Tumulicola sp.]|nr:hypothetical protein [Candidatus Tumulicola sp.]